MTRPSSPLNDTRHPGFAASGAVCSIIDPMPRSVKTVLLVANGDLRQSANQVCWPAQVAMEKKLAAAVAAQGCRLQRAHPYKPAVKNGFIASQKEGLEVFAQLDPAAPL